MDNGMPQVNMQHLDEIMGDLNGVVTRPMHSESYPQFQAEQWQNHHHMGGQGGGGGGPFYGNEQEGASSFSYMNNGHAGAGCGQQDYSGNFGGSSAYMTSDGSGALGMPEQHHSALTTTPRHPSQPLHSQQQQKQPHLQTQQQQQQQQHRDMHSSTGGKPSTPDLVSKRAAVIASMKQREDSQAPSEGSNKPQESTQGTNMSPDETNNTRRPPPLAGANATPAQTLSSSKATSGDVTQSLGDEDAPTIETSQSTDNPENNRGHHRATAADIDGLLAEGKAAAANTSSAVRNEKAASSPLKRQNTANNEEHGFDTPTRQGTGTGLARKQQQTDEMKSEGSKPEGLKDAFDSIGPMHKSRATLLSKDDDFNAAIFDEEPRPEQKKPQQQQSPGTALRERRLYEPPKRASTIDESAFAGKRASTFKEIAHPVSRPHYKIDNRSNGTKQPATTAPAPGPKPAPAPAPKSAAKPAPAPAPKSAPKSAPNPGPKPSKNATGKQPKPDHEFSQLQPEEVEELREWLVLTGYNDESYRRKTLHRHKRLAALEQERADLMKEEQSERDAAITTRGNPTRSNTLLSSSSFQSSEKATEPSPPPPSPPSPASNKPARAPPATSANAVPVARPTPKAQSDDDGQHAAPSTTETEKQDPDSMDQKMWDRPEYHHPISLKRLHSSTPSYEAESGRPKVPRVSTTGLKGDDMPDHEGYEAMRPNKRGRGAAAFAARGRGEFRHRANTFELGPRGRGYFHERPDEVDDYAGYRHRDGGMYAPRRPARGRGRGRFMGYSPRGSMRGGMRSFGPHSTPSYLAPPGLWRTGSVEHDNSRFFLIKSLSYEYVEASQREGVWATQVKNGGKFAEAFSSCQNVILIFSVNSSKAFQGYARMETMPDEKRAPTPSWVDKLNWEISPPFRVKWITTAETGFRAANHLNNAYNEDSIVFIGRDGQEIEPHCGINLCTLLDKSSESAALY